VATIGNLYVNIVGRVSGFASPLMRAVSSLRVFGKSVGGIMKGIQGFTKALNFGLLAAGLLTIGQMVKRLIGWFGAGMSEAIMLSAYRFKGSMELVRQGSVAWTQFKLSVARAIAPLTELALGQWIGQGVAAMEQWKDSLNEVRVVLTLIYGMFMNAVAVVRLVANVVTMVLRVALVAVLSVVTAIAAVIESIAWFFVGSDFANTKGAAAAVVEMAGGIGTDVKDIGQGFGNAFEAFGNVANPANPRPIETGIQSSEMAIMSAQTIQTDQGPKVVEVLRNILDEVRQVAPR
jgi:hypothetical protein